MVSRDFSRRSLHSCIHAVYGRRCGFRVLDQGLGRRWRRRRMHRRCIGCEENTRQGSSPRTRPQEMNHGPISKPSKVHFLVRPGSHFPAPAVRFATARRARLSQCWPPLRRPPAGLGIDQPSTVLRLQEAVTVIGTVLFAILLSCGSDRRPQGPRPAPSGQAGLGRAANARRAIEHGPRPFGEEPPVRWLIFNRAFLMPAEDSASHRAQHRQGRALRVGLRPSLDSACARRNSGAARSGRGNGLQVEQGNWAEMVSKAPLAPSHQVHRKSCTNTSQNCTEVPAFTRFTLLAGLPIRVRFLSVLNAHDLTVSGTHCDDALSDHRAA